jgi:hypothetical protein
MRSPTLEKDKQIHYKPCQHEERAEDDYDGERASRMTKVLLAILDARGFG